MSALSLHIPQAANCCIMRASPNNGRFVGDCDRCFNSPMTPCFTLMSSSGVRRVASSGASDIGGLIIAEACASVPMSRSTNQKGET